MQNELCKNQIEQLNTIGSIGSSILYYDQLTSTFDKIRELELKDGLTVVCSKQTCGSGRLGRKWESPKGGIYFTFALTPPYNGFDIPFITTVCALGVQKALDKYIVCRIKWPNDIVADGKKICGILTRNIVSSGTVNAVLVGIGVNVNNDTFPGDLPYASSLKTILGKEVDENNILAEIINCINNVYDHMSTEEILREYTAACVNPGREVTIHYASDGKSAKGICTGILADGSMNVEIDGKKVNVHSGEVSVEGIYS